MVRAGDEVENPATRERVVFLRTAADTGGELLEMENVWTRPDHATAPHLHPGMEETWEVLSGLVRFRIGEEDRVAGPGEVVSAPPGVPHRAWNESGGEARLRITMRPALRWEEFVVRMFADPASVTALLPEFGDEVVPAPL
jgi:quercetin dioxygenase-like cupin family protein